MEITQDMILAADYHRNGVSGRGFYVGIIRDEDGSRKLIIDFPGNECRTAVLDLDKAAEGNIFTHPTDGHPGGNAWRGDHYTGAASAFAYRRFGEDTTK